MQLPAVERNAPRAGTPDREEIDGMELDYRRESRCHVCSAGDTARILVDQLLVRGYTYMTILQAVEPLERETEAKHRISYDSVRRHQLRHLPVDELAVRTAIERRARQQDLRVALGDVPLLTNTAVLEVIRNAGFESIITGAVIPTVRETIVAATTLETLDREAGNQPDLPEVRAQIDLLLSLVRERVGKSEWADLVTAFEERIGSPAKTPKPPDPDASDGAA